MASNFVPTPRVGVGHCGAWRLSGSTTRVATGCERGGVLLMNDRTQKAAKTPHAASDGVPPRCRSYYPYQHLTDPLYFLWHLCVRPGWHVAARPPASAVGSSKRRRGLLAESRPWSQAAPSRPDYCAHNHIHLLPLTLLSHRPIDRIVGYPDRAVWHTPSRYHAPTLLKQKGCEPP